MATQKKGKGWHGDPEGHKKAGQKGGRATSKNHDSAFYSKIGSIGGSKSGGNFKNNPERARQAGRKGGKSKVRITI